MSPEEFHESYNVSRETLERLKAYDALLVKWQKAINLVSPSTVSESWNRHFADSVQIADLIPHGTRIADLGSGAGFPGLVLAILRPDLDMHLIESDGRKCEFLKNVSRETAAAVAVHNRRVEDILPELKPGIITARAFKSLREILAMTYESGADYCLLKGKNAQEEVAEARRAFEFEVEYKPSRTEQGAQILLIRKVRSK